MYAEATAPRMGIVECGHGGKVVYEGGKTHTQLRDVAEGGRVMVDGGQILRWWKVMCVEGGRWERGRPNEGKYVKEVWMMVKGEE